MTPLDWGMTALLMVAYSWVIWQASRLAFLTAGQERLCWVGLALLPVHALLLLGLHALTPPDLWRDVLLEAQRPRHRGGSEAWPLRLLLWINVLLPVQFGAVLPRSREVPRSGLAVLW